MRVSPVQIHRIDAKLLFILALTGSAALGCSSPAVGDPCLPEQVPETGFDEREAYVESSSVQCQTRVCIVYQLDGDPRDSCIETGPTICPPEDPNCVEGVRCASGEEVEDRIFCTCRCDAGDSDFAECECPDGFACQEVLQRGGPGVQGSYCVRNNTLR